MRFRRRHGLVFDAHGSSNARARATAFWPVAHLVVALWGGALGVGCVHETRVMTNPAGVSLILDDTNHGVVPHDGLVVDIPMGFSEIPYQLLDEENHVVDEGVIVRDTIRGVGHAPLACGVVGTVVGMPLCAGMMFSLVNPSFLLAPVAAALACSTAPVVAACSAPTALTLPAVALGACAGALPSTLTLVSEGPPSVLVLGSSAPLAPSVREDSGDDADAVDSVRPSSSSNETSPPLRY